MRFYLDMAYYALTLLKIYCANQSSKSNKKNTRFDPDQRTVILTRATALFNEAWTENFISLANKFKLNQEKTLAKLLRLSQYIDVAFS